MSSEYQDAWNELVAGVAAVKPFPYSNFVNRLHNKVRNWFASTSGAGDILRPYIGSAPNYPVDEPDPGSYRVDIFDIVDLLDRLSLSAASDGIASNDEDPEHLKSCISQENSQLRYLESLTNLMGFFFLEHINMELRAKGRRDLNTLYQIDGFKDYCINQINSDDFIRVQILHDLSAGDHRFSISFLIIADYMDNREFVFRSTPSSGSDFTSKASFKTLSQWSYTLWANGGQGSPDQMDQIVSFCGKSATIGLCPPSPSTGLQRPTSVSTVMKSFYGMASDARIKDSAYDADVQASLSRLENEAEILDEWKSYCDTFSSNWKAQIRSYWSTAFFRIFQDGQSRMAKLWLSSAKQDQSMVYSWDSYLPVTKDPYDTLRLKQSSISAIPAGTPLTLADGSTRAIEDIDAGDQILVVAGSKKVSVHVAATPSHEPGRVRLVGFNGERPTIPSSQVFHTPTGLKAVDPEEAQRINPYQQIGKLAVGHILYCLKRGQYEAVSIDSITLTEEHDIDRIYNLTLLGENQTYHVHGYLVDMNAPSQTISEIVGLLRNVPGNKRLSILSHFQEMWPLFRKFDAQCLNQRLNHELFGKYKSPDGRYPKLKGSVSFSEHVKLGEKFVKPAGVPVNKLTRGYFLTPNEPDRLPAGYRLPTLTVIEGYLLIDNQVELRSTYDARTRRFRWTRELQQLGVFENGLFEVYSDAASGAGVVYLSNDSEDNTTPSRNQVHPFEARARSLEDIQRGTPRDGDDWVTTWQPFGEYQVTVDQDIWPPDTERTTPVKPVDGGLMEIGTMKSPLGVSTMLVQIPLLNQLRDQINQKFGGDLDTFHKVSGIYQNGLQSYTVSFDKATMVPFVSDTGLDINKTFGVGFGPQLGIDVTLPVLFEQMTMTFDVMYETFTGYLFEYNPEMRGYRGDRHLVTGKRKVTRAIEQLRLRVSSAYAAVSDPITTVGKDVKLQPAPVTKILAPLATLSISNLMACPEYNERDLHNTSQLLIKNMMYYHMDATQRETLLREPKPVVGQDIPSSLADQLPQNLKTFFKEKYGPAFICRYVGKTQKYSPQFTEREMKNLWYWWEGNGKNCLSQSVEYNDINRLSSRAAMLSLYSKHLDPYRNDNPEKWAGDLCTQLVNDKFLMMIYVNNPVPDGNNVVNKQCNIMDALSATPENAQEYFEAFMNFAWEQGASSADIEGGNQDEQYKWIHDSMNQLIVAILSGSAEISDAVRQALMEQINEFEIQNGLNQQLDAEQRAAAILEKTTIFTRELAGWMTSIGKGLQTAFGGTALFKWAGQAFDKVAGNFASKIPAVDKLKGISSLCMVGVTLATAAVSIWGLTQNWDSMSDAGRATVIIQVVRMTADAAGQAINAFKEFTSKPATTAADQINMDVLNDSLSKSIKGGKGNASGIAQEISGDVEYRTAMGEGLQGKGLPGETKPGDTWNEKVGDAAEGIPSGYEETAKKYNISGNILKILNVILGIGLVIAMSFSLANDWSSLTDVGKALGVLNVVVQGLTVLLDIISLGEAIGLYAITGTMSVALPILGAVLAVVGIVLMVVQFFISLFVGRQDPPDPIQDFIDDVGHKLIGTFDQAPDPKLSYTISQNQVQGGSVIALRIEGVNKSSSQVIVSYVTITLYSGNDDVCLFAEGSSTIQLVAENDEHATSPGYTYVTPSEKSAGQLPYPAKLGNTSEYYQYDLQVAGPPNEFSASLKALVLEQNDKFQSVWTATVNYPGDDAEKSTSWIEVVEVGMKDKCQQQFMLRRV